MDTLLKNKEYFTLKITVGTWLEMCNWKTENEVE
jgi:hypothetical protein